MKITETIDRECCDERKDLKPYRGAKKADPPGAGRIWKFHFCVHCGQVWVEDSVMGPAGSREPTLRKIEVEP